MADEATLLAQAALRDSGAVSPQDAVLVALHSNLLSAGFLCVATGDEVGLLACMVHRQLGVWAIMHTNLVSS